MCLYTAIGYAGCTFFFLIQTEHGPATSRKAEVGKRHDRPCTQIFPTVDFVDDYLLYYINNDFVVSRVSGETCDEMGAHQIDWQRKGGRFFVCLLGRRGMCGRNSVLLTMALAGESPTCVLREGTQTP